MKIFGGIVALVLGLALLFGAGLGARWVSLQVERWFAPQEENVRREVFENTKSYNEGKEQELVKYRLEYMRSDDDAEKKAIAAAVRHAFADYEEDRLSPELQAFLKQCKYGGFR